MIVADTNVIVYLYVASTQTEIVNAAFAQDSDWVAPFLWKSEFRNALLQYMRHQIISLGEAGQLAKAAERLLMGKEYQVSSDKVLRLATDSDCTAYDCEFVVLAQDLSVPLVTVDKKVLREFPRTAVSLAQFVNHE